MKKKILALCLVVVLAVTAVTGVTLAYFTDTDADVNVMTTGNIMIVQNETDRNGDAWSKDGVAHLVPAVYLKADDEGNMVPYNPAKNGKGYTSEGPGGYGPQTVDGKEMWYTGTMKDTDGEGMVKIYHDNIENEIDKVISVTNKGTEPAFIRTILVVENDAENEIWDAIHCMWNNSDGQYRKWIGDDGSVEIDGTTYSVAVCTYNTPLEAGETSAPSLMQLFLDPYADSSWYDLLGDGQLDIFAISQATQTTGFTSATQALDTAFGEVTVDNVKDWVAKSVIKTNSVNNVIGGERPTEAPAEEG